MATAPITSERTSDLQIAVNDPKTPKSPVTDVTVSQLLMSKAPPTAPSTPLSELLGKRKTLNPARCYVSSKNAKNKCSPSKNKVKDDPSRMSLRLGKEKATKNSNAPVQMTQTMIRAREIQSTLGNEHPSFIKTMLRSHGVPLPFGRSFLPKDDSLIVVEDENGGQCNVNFIAHRFGFSGGWRQFAVTHKLVEGDVLIFQLVESCKFKIYIVRANYSKEVDGAVNFRNQDAQAKHKIPAMVKPYSISRGRKPSILGSSSLLTRVKRKYKRSKPPTQLNSHAVDHSEVNSQVQESSPQPKLSLKEVKTFKDFHIFVDNQCIDLELSEEIRMNYHNLCIGKNEILHDGVREGLYYKLVAGMIGEIVSIANMIKNCKLTTKKEEFDAWDSSLKYFELMGMKVGFIRDRVRTLANFTCESNDALRYLEAKEERNRNADEIKILEAKLVELYESNRKIDGVLDDLNEKAERYEIEFLKKVDAPW